MTIRTVMNSYEHPARSKTGLLV